MSTTTVKSAPEFAFKLSDTEWRQRLTPEQYKVMRGHGTERACTSPLNAEKRQGVYQCAGCGHPLFDTAAKFESGTGWPSFFRADRPRVGRDLGGSGLRHGPDRSALRSMWEPFGPRFPGWAPAHW